MSSMNSSPNIAGALPPFIPGLLIVSLLIVVSVLIGWRNYLRRGRTGTTANANEWLAWRLQATETESRRPERPKLWEVAVEERDQMRRGFGGGWEKALPLSATSIEDDITLDEPYNDIPAPPLATQTSSRRWLPTLNYLAPKSPEPTLAAVAETPSPPPPPLPQLQLSFLVSMPDPSCPTYLVAPPYAGTSNSSAEEMESTHPTSAKYHHASHSHETLQEAQGPPEVAFGLITIPWDKDAIENGLPSHKGEDDAE
ncbi:hypothetical protein M422DRAFT_38864 [Sphaerobolus stellatus SS14]|uniref:Uncharacterized protein n=1 Tax=Sphaerobolus stellatus (strain SS14) TaxID=990650 RepID=A0A0C9UIM9_SPHS4|nr:hypothetical protein M422DRAFT_38864 [Sphaerobolus stellatus SS14]